MSTEILERLAAFDDEDMLNEDGTVTFRIIPSNWHAYNISPDTYQSFNGDSWVESTVEWFNEQVTYWQDGKPPEWAYLGRPVEYDDFEWTYDHAAIVRSLAEDACNWISETLWALGLESVRAEVVDSWSPKFYNFQSDGFEVEVTCDPAELRSLTEDFDVDQHVSEHYRSYDGFLSFVTSRMNDDDWRRGYDAEFRVEHLLASAPDAPERNWIYRLAEAETEVYMEHVRVEFLHPEYMGSGYSLPELEEWAYDLTPRQPESLPGV
jgi:hypothetical protein